ncbi:major facilitator superfamily domain-containing protein, partial [Vararia minispora EC-137]
EVILFTSLAVPVYLETLDYTVVATAQPTIASHFNRLNLQSYIGTIYLLTSTVFLPLYASVADIYGRHFTLQTSLLFFLVGSAISTGSFSMITMLVGRGIAGIGAAGMLALPRIILADSASLAQQNVQISMLMILYAIGYVTGPIIGGALSSVSFRWIFAINLPAALLAMIIAFFLLRGRSDYTRDMTDKRMQHVMSQSRIGKLASLDWIGTALFVAAGILILLALNWGSTEKWSSVKVIVSFVVGGVLFLLCVGWEAFLQARQANRPTTRLWRMFPMLPIEVFSTLDSFATQAVSFGAGLVMLVMFYYLAVFFVIVNGSSNTNAGVQLLYFAPGMGAGAFISQAIIRRTKQPKYAVMAGTLITTVALGLVSQGVHTSSNGMVNGHVPTLFMAGTGVGLTLGPAGAHARFAQAVSRVAIVTSYLRFSQNLGGTVGLAQAAAVLNARVHSYIASQVATGAISPSDAAALQLSGSSLSSINAINALPQGLNNIVKDAFRDGTRWLFISMIPWAGVCFLLSLFLENISEHPPQEDR